MKRDKKESTPGPRLSDTQYLRALLDYDGPSTRREVAYEDGALITTYLRSSANERKAATLLSAKGIPFAIDVTDIGWTGTGTQRRMIITVPTNRYEEASAVLKAAERASMLKAVEGVDRINQEPWSPKNQK